MLILYSAFKINICYFQCHIEPSTYKQAIKCDNWIKAMDDKIAAQNQNKTWTITELKGKKAHWMQVDVLNQTQV
jgi:hypothetical protein